MAKRVALPIALSSILVACAGHPTRPQPPVPSVETTSLSAPRGADNRNTPQGAPAKSALEPAKAAVGVDPADMDAALEHVDAILHGLEQRLETEHGATKGK